MELSSLGAFELSEKIKSQEISSKEVVEEQISQIKKWNPHLNAIIQERFELALKEAQHCDQNIKQNLNKKLWGVPITVKEVIAVKDMKSTLGSVYRRNQIMNQDATIVARLKQQGAIVLGTTNVPEIGLWYETENKVYGRTNNPYDLTRTPGGSSGGESAIISSGCSFMGLGSDVGGSIRMPSAFCGIFGHKPSEKIIPTTGHFPLYPSTSQQIRGTRYPMTVVGPLARKAIDLEKCLDLIVGPDSYDSEATRPLPPKILDFDIKNLKLYVLASPIFHGVSSADAIIENSVIQTAQELEKLGAQIYELPRNFFLSALRGWVARMRTVEGRNFQDILTSGQGFNLTPELFRKLTGRGYHTLPALLTAIAEKTNQPHKSEFDKDLHDLSLTRNLLNQTLGKNGVLIMPAFPRVAPKHSTTYTRPFDFIYSGVFNALGNPSTVAPIKMSGEGLPIGIQIVSADLNDFLSIKVAKYIEDIFGGWTAPQLRT